MEQSKSHSYKCITELKNDTGVILLAQTAFCMNEVYPQAWPLLTGRPPGSQMSQPRRPNTGTAALSQDLVQMKKWISLSEEKVLNCFTLLGRCVTLQMEGWG